MTGLWGRSRVPDLSGVPLYGRAHTRAVTEVIAVGSIVIAISIAIVVVAEIGRRWAERRLVSAP